MSATIRQPLIFPPCANLSRNLLNASMSLFSRCPHCHSSQLQQPLPLSPAPPAVPLPLPSLLPPQACSVHPPPPLPHPSSAWVAQVQLSVVLYSSEAPRAQFHLSVAEAILSHLSVVVVHLLLVVALFLHRHFLRPLGQFQPLPLLVLLSPLLPPAFSFHRPDKATISRGLRASIVNVCALPFSYFSIFLSSAIRFAINVKVIRFPMVLL